MGLFYLYATAESEIHICLNKHEIGLTVATEIVVLETKFLNPSNALKKSSSFRFIKLYIVHEYNQNLYF